MGKIAVSGKRCPVSRTLTIIGEKWTVLILRDIFLKGPQKYQDFSESLEGISPNLLSTRLKKLLEHKLIEKELYSEHPPRYQYNLTPLGKSLRPVLEVLRDWGKANTKYK